MSIIQINRCEHLRRQAFFDQIWGYVESPYETVCYDPALPLYCPPALIQEVRYAVH